MLSTSHTLSFLVCVLTKENHKPGASMLLFLTLSVVLSPLQYGPIFQVLILCHFSSLFSRLQFVNGQDVSSR